VVPRIPFVPDFGEGIFIFLLLTRSIAVSNEITQQGMIRWSDVTPVEMIPNLFRRTLGTTASAQVVEVRAKAGVVVPLHKHPNEQVGYVVSGEMELTIAGVPYLCQPGDSYAIPGNASTVLSLAR
jgi:quercetin dioxygenase-like cupin family protein